MRSIHSIISDAEILLALEPEELAGVVLEYLNSLTYMERGQLNRYNFSLPDTVQEYPRQYQEQISKALMEAWVWLEREGLLAPEPGKDHGWVFITRRGQQFKNASDLKAYRQANILPKQFLHPVIASKVWSSFIRGEYDTAVFQAFKEIEVAVRTAGGFSLTDIGTTLMRKAFDHKSGPLKDPNVPEAEQEALAHFFAGAIGLYKNPHSHRNQPITDPVEAMEIIVLASNLLKIIDSKENNDNITR